MRALTVPGAEQTGKTRRHLKIERMHLGTRPVLDHAAGMLLLAGGDVVDGTGAPHRRADVLCDDHGKIVQVASAMPAGGATVLDCGGLVVTPGFIDTHAHTDLEVLAAPSLEMKVWQGVTLDVVGQDGLSVAPVRAEDVATQKSDLAWLVGDPPGVDRHLPSVTAYLDAVDAAHPSIDVAYLVPHGALRVMAVGHQARPASAVELHQMRTELLVGMAQGALGLSTGLIYPPCSYADTEELVALCSAVAQAGGVLAVHLRSESDDMVGAVQEMLEVAVRTRVHLHLSHIKVLGQRNWQHAVAVLALVEAARDDGLNVTADQYPYTASSTALAQLLPSWALANGTAATLARLREPATKARIRESMLDPQPGEGAGAYLRMGPDAIRIADAPSEAARTLRGSTLAQAGVQRGLHPVDLVLSLLEQEELAVTMVGFSQDEAVVERFMPRSWVNLCTDGLPGRHPHPRTWGSFPRVLARYVRERKVLTLEDAVRKMSAQAARAMHLDDRGLVAPGMRADLVVLDPATVEDTATFEQPCQRPRGIEHVLVAGQPVLAQGKRTKAQPGGSVRGGTTTR